MLFFVFGFPGEFTEWCRAATATLAREAGQPAVLVDADTLDGLAVEILKAGASQAVVASSRPGGRLRVALIEAQRNFLVALDDPRAALIDLAIRRGLDLIDAVRILASSCATLDVCSRLRGALALDAGRWRSQPGAIAVAIARHLQISLAEEAASDAVGTLPAGTAMAAHENAVAWWNGLDPRQREMVVGALAPYLEMGLSGAEVPITWTGELFSACCRPGSRASEPIDITGRARRIIEGPHIALPAGAWSLMLTLSCTREAAEHEFRVEVAADGPVAAGTIRPHAAGNASLSLDFAIEELTDYPVTIRISTVRAAFDGAISVVAATLMRAAAGSPAA